MFGDIGWAELLIIGVVALIVIGPEDLPEMFRQLGRFTAKIRAMAREFQRTMDQAAKESGVDDVARDLKTATSPKSLGLTAVKEAADKFEKWDPLKPTPRSGSAAKPAAEPVVAPTPEPQSAEVQTTAAGPETQALRAKQAQRKAVLRETADRLKAIDKGADKLADTPAPAKPAAKPRAPRKKKAPEA